MSGCCSIRALWILNAQDAVVFSRRFPTVERRWRQACETENRNSPGGYAVKPLLPRDAELATAFGDRKAREGSVRGSGIRVSQASQRSIDSWADDPITRHIIALSVDAEDGGEVLLWPLVLHVKSYFYIVVLPFVEPRYLKALVAMSSRSDCGNSIQGNENVSSLLLGLPCITGSLMVAGAVGDVITGDSGDPEVVPSSSSASVGGLLDSLTGSIGIGGISTRAKPVANVSSTPAAAVTGPVSSEAPKATTKPIDKEALRTFIATSMPFGTPLDLNFANMNAIRLGGFSSADPPPSDLRLPAWKPYLYKGKQRVLFTVQEVVSAALYDRDEIPDSTTISGQVNCRAELEGLPDVTCHLAGRTYLEATSFHPCTQIPERGGDGQSVMFTPPLGNFVLMRYQVSKGLNSPVKGFYQLSMVSEDEGAFLFKLRVMEGYKSPVTMEFCTVTMPFPQRKVVSLDGNPSVGTASMSDHAIEWKVVTSGRSITGKSVETIFPGTVKFAPLSPQRKPSSRPPLQGNFLEDECELESETSSNSTNIEDFLIEKMNKVIISADLDEPLCWQAYNYAKVSFKIFGGTVSGFSLDPKSVNVYPTSKTSTDLSMQVSSGDYILWNTLGKCPVAALPNGR